MDVTPQIIWIHCSAELMVQNKDYCVMKMHQTVVTGLNSTVTNSRFDAMVCNSNSGIGIGFWPFSVSGELESELN